MSEKTRWNDPADRIVSAYVSLAEGNICVMACESYVTQERTLTPSLFLFFLLILLAPFSVCALFSSPSVFLAPMGYGGHRSPVATGGTSGEPQEEYLLLVPQVSGSSLDALTSKGTREPARNSGNCGEASSPLYTHDIF